MTLLGIDYGERRIGLAVTDALRIIASPLETIENDERCIQRLKDIVEERGVDTVVVGLPLKLDGGLGPAAQNTLRFVDKLKVELGATVETFDERLTTAQAERSMLAHDISRAKRAKRIDQMAAQIMLQSYLDASKRKMNTDSDAE